MQLADWPSRKRPLSSTLDEDEEQPSRRRSPSPPSTQSSRSGGGRGHTRSSSQGQEASIPSQGRNTGVRGDASNHDYQTTSGTADGEEEELMRLAMIPEMTDVVAGISLLVSKLHGSQGPFSLCPLILQHQLYTVLNDATAVDVEIESLRRQNFIRMLRLLTTKGDVGLVLTSTYNHRIDVAIQTSSTSNSSLHHALVFLKELVKRFTGVSITRHDLDSIPKKTLQDLHILPSSASSSSVSSSSSACGGDDDSQAKQTKRDGADQEREQSKALEGTLRQLITSGFLARRVDCRLEEAYWFSAPELGRITASLPVGRKAIVAAIKRSRYKEVIERNLKNLDIKKTELSMDFHLSDLIGQREIIPVETSAGPFLRLHLVKASASGGGGSRR